ncbi:hypothetical protein QJQ45_011339 [Haematococcus lacustris]|nr:hypothetical protein QJQ45_011339 [Haematococcus lacustris]
MWQPDHPAQLGFEPATLLKGKKTLQFPVCNGMANQRLSLLYGVMLAHELGRVAILPDFLLSGVQWDEKDVVAGKETGSVPMSRLYDVQKFVSSTAAMGVEVVDVPDLLRAQLHATAVDVSGMADVVDQLSLNYNSTQHISIGCPIFKLTASTFTGVNKRVMWAIADGLQPSQRLAQSINSIVTSMQRMTPSHTFNYVHLRMEGDWVLHCERWEHIADGKVRDNCFNNTYTVDQVLEVMHVAKHVPLYVATFWQQADAKDADRVLAKLRAVGYMVITSRHHANHFTGDREVDALLEYGMALQAERMLGNSVSTFSALAIMQRRHAGQWATWYNWGTVPMDEFLPMDLLPWVFPYSDRTPHQDYMVRAAVRSATAYASLQPFCLWSGADTSPMAAWLRSQGVTLIQHQPAWAAGLWPQVSDSLSAAARNSSIFTSQAAMVADLARLDIPVLPQLEQYVYVLYTEPTTFFMRRPSLVAFPLPLTQSISMVADPRAPAGIDTSVALLHLPALRQSYPALQHMVRAHEGGGSYGSYGLGAAGALRQLYATQLAQRPLSLNFAAKAQDPFIPSATIVHFNGPLPHQYLQYYRTQQCPLPGGACKQGLNAGLCPYIKQWNQHLAVEDVEGKSMWLACLALFAPHLRGLTTASGLL